MMQSLPRLTYNRHVLLLKPKQPFLDWLMMTDPPPPSLSLAELRDDVNAYLIPEFDLTEQARKWVMQRWRWFFEEQLGDWLTDPNLWPEKRTPQMFRQFFDIEFHSMVFDVSAKALEIEDWSDGDDEG
ncbi:MAG: hypothetical protein WBP86_12010 [Thiobacillaceae bacterium]